MKLQLVNRIEPFAQGIDQYALVDETGTIVGGFSLALPVDEKQAALIMGFHADSKGDLTWVFHELRKIYPNRKRLTGYRSTGKRRGQFTLKAGDRGRGWVRE